MAFYGSEPTRDSTVWTMAGSCMFRVCRRELFSRSGRINPARCMSM